MKKQTETAGAHVAVYMYAFDNNKCRDLIFSIVLCNAAGGIIMFTI